MYMGFSVICKEKKYMYIKEKIVVNMYFKFYMKLNDFGFLVVYYWFGWFDMRLFFEFDLDY